MTIYSVFKKALYRTYLEITENMGYLDPNMPYLREITISFNQSIQRFILIKIKILKDSLKLKFIFIFHKYFHKLMIKNGPHCE